MEDSKSNTVPTEDQADDQVQSSAPNQETQEKSPVEEARELLEENKKVLAQLTEERKKIEKATANAMMSGRGIAGKPEKSKEEQHKEKAQKLADEITKDFI